MERALACVIQANDTACLPLSWSEIGTCAFLPTLVAAIGFGVVGLVALLFERL